MTESSAKDVPTFQPSALFRSIVTDGSDCWMLDCMMGVVQSWVSREWYDVLPDVDVVREYRKRYEMFQEAEQDYRRFFADGGKGGYLETDEEVSRAYGSPVTREEFYGAHLLPTDEWLELALRKNPEKSIIDGFIERVLKTRNEYECLLPDSVVYIASHDVIHSPELEQHRDAMRQRFDAVRADKDASDDELYSAQQNLYLSTVCAEPYKYLRHMFYDEMLWMNVQQDIIVYENDREMEYMRQYQELDGNVSDEWATSAGKRFNAWYT